MLSNLFPCISVFNCFPKFLCLPPLLALCVENQEAKGCKAVSCMAISCFSMSKETLRLGSWLLLILKILPGRRRPKGPLDEVVLFLILHDQISLFWRCLGMRGGSAICDLSWLSLILYGWFSYTIFFWKKKELSGTARVSYWMAEEIEYLRLLSKNHKMRISRQFQNLSRFLNFNFLFSFGGSGQEGWGGFLHFSFSLRTRLAFTPSLELVLWECCVNHQCWGPHPSGKRPTQGAADERVRNSVSRCFFM